MCLISQPNGHRDFFGDGFCQYRRLLGVCRCWHLRRGEKTASSRGCHAWPAANLQPTGRHRDHRSDVSGDGCGFNVDFYGLGGALRGRSTRASDADNLAPAMAYANPGPIRTDCGLSFTSTIAHCAPPKGRSDDPTIGKAPGTPHSVFIFFTGVSWAVKRRTYAAVRRASSELGVSLIFS